MHDIQNRRLEEVAAILSQPDEGDRQLVRAGDLARYEINKWLEFSARQKRL
jgi:hypothetical protein